MGISDNFHFSYILVSEAGIKCWVCNSRNDLGCGDPFDNSSFPISDCDAEFNRRENLIGIKATMCRKIVQKGWNHKYNEYYQSFRHVRWNSICMYL